MYLTPPVGLQGRYTFKEPLDIYNNGTLIYECVALRSFSDYLNDNDDPKEVYIELGIESAYDEEAVDTAIYFVTLQGKDGTFLVIPNSYIESIPMMEGVAYTRRVLILDLGAMPKHLDLTTLGNKVVGVAEEFVNPPNKQVVFVDDPFEEVVDQAKHEHLEAARLASVNLSISDHRRVIELTREVDRLTQLNTVLSQQLIDLTT